MLSPRNERALPVTGRARSCVNLCAVTRSVLSALLTTILAVVVRQLWDRNPQHFKVAATDLVRDAGIDVVIPLLQFLSRATIRMPLHVHKLVHDRSETIAKWRLTQPDAHFARRR